MENSQMPPVQSMQQTTPVVSQMNNGGQQIQVPLESKKNATNLTMTIVAVIASLVALTFIGLFIWIFIQYNDISGDVQDKIDIAVAEAKDEQSAKMEAEFLEREKYPYRTFSGPVDYGQLTFEYPKTWSVYVAADASNGGNYEAYFNPIQVDKVGKNTINALRVEIRDKSFDNVVSEYERALNNKNSELKIETITINGVTANKYTGKIPGTDFSGYILIFKIRDKTAILQTDSILFQEDFDKIISTITFNA